MSETFWPPLPEVVAVEDLAQLIVELVDAAKIADDMLDRVRRALAAAYERGITAGHSGYERDLLFMADLRAGEQRALAEQRAAAALEALQTTRCNLLSLCASKPGVTTYDKWLAMIERTIATVTAAEPARSATEPAQKSEPPSPTGDT